MHIRSLRWLTSLAALQLAIALVGCNCDPRPPIEFPDAGMPDSPISRDGGPGFSDSSFSRSDLAITRVVPDHGPFIGGNTAILRGTGFTDMSQVYFGTHAVQPADHLLIDSRRLQVTVPAGEVGSVEVRVEVGDAMFTLPAAYTYDAISVDPTSGSVSGGTFVNIIGSGTAFAEGDTVTFGRTPCTRVEVVSETRITCRTPTAIPSTVDVTVTHAADASTTTAIGAFTYYETADPFSGGLGGGPINGSINLTAINAFTGDPVPGAFAIVGEDLATENQGLTSVTGQITFSGPELIGTQTIHVAKHCFERTSVIAFDAQDVTVFLVPWMDPMCGMGNPGGGGRGRNGSFVEGELIWRGPNEFGPNPWANIPEPRTGWNRIAYVFTTQSGVGRPNPAPETGGTNRVLERIVPTSEKGYPYRIFARPAGLAVYALAGLENPALGQFIPYVMGVGRNVLAGPGETVSNVDVIMDIPLDHNIEATLGARPMPATGGPDTFRLEATLDLGGEGVIVRAFDRFNFDVIRRRDDSRALRFVAEPALRGTLVDGRFRITAGWYTGQYDQYPYTTLVQTGVTAVDEVVALPAFMGIPDTISPAPGAPLPSDRMMRWRSTEGGLPPDFQMIYIVGGDGNPAWRMIVPGDVFEAPFPDLSSIEGVDDISPGTVFWAIEAARVPGFDFNEFRYTYLNDQYQSHHAFNQFNASF
jgi:hypothetical protein